MFPHPTPPPDPSPHSGTAGPSKGKRPKTPDPSPRFTAADVTAVHAAWKHAQPNTRHLTPDNEKAIRRLLVECGDTDTACVYLLWLAESDEEYARQLRGQTPWPDGRTCCYVDNLVGAVRSVPTRLAKAQAWDARGRRDECNTRATPTRAPSRADAAFDGFLDMWQESQLQDVADPLRLASK